MRNLTQKVFYIFLLPNLFSQSLDDDMNMDSSGEDDDDDDESPANLSLSNEVTLGIILLRLIIQC